MTYYRENKDTKSMIMDSAVEIMLKKGYSKTTLEDIVKNINMTRGAFYWYFKNKKELLVEIEKSYTQNYFRDYSEFKVLESANKTLLILIENQIKKIFNDDYINWVYLFRYRVEALTELPDLFEKQREVDAYSIQKIEEQIVRGIKAGEFKKDIVAKDVAIQIFSFIVGIENTAMLHDGDSNFSYSKYKTGAKNIMNALKR